MKIVCVRDIKANIYSNPIFVAHIAGAIRSFGDECVKDKDANALAAHPEDYELMFLGDFDETTGKFSLQENPTQLAVGSNFRAK